MPRSVIISPRRWVLLLAGLLFLSAGVVQARGRPQERTLDAPFGRAHFEILKDHVGEGDAVIRCRVTDVRGEWPADALTLHYRMQGGTWREVHFWRAKELGQEPTGAAEVYEASIPNAGRGVAVDYYVQLELAPGQPLRLPGSAPTHAFSLTFKGRPSTPLIAAHVLCMMLGLVILLIGMVGAIVFLSRGRLLALHRRSTLIGFLLLFLGSLPLGIAVERQVFGTFWEGWPFGRDVTDTKTGVILLLWLILLLVRGRAIWSPLPATQRPRDRAWAGWLIAIAIFTVIMYLIPHENLKF